MAPDRHSIAPVPSPSRRPPYARAALLLLALLSAVMLGNAQAVSCAMHGLGAAKADAGTGAAMADHAGMAGMSHEGGTPDAGGHHGCCTCIDECAMVAPLASAPTAATVLVASIVPLPRRPIDVEPREAPEIEPDRLLPFANGPPGPALG